MSTNEQYQPILVTASVLAVSSLTVMANATISPSLPGLAAAFSETPGIETLSGLVLSLPSLSVVLTAALFGLLVDRFDRRVLLVIVMVLYAVAGASGTVARSMTELLIGRVLLGVAVAGIMTIATQLAADLWQGSARARFMGWQGAAMSGGGIFFLLVGGFLAEQSWRGPFLIYLAALPLAALAWIALNRRTDTQAGVGETAKAHFPWQRFAIVGGLAFFGMVCFYIVPTRLPFWMNELGITSPSTVGFAIATMTAASLPGALYFGRIRERFSHEGIFAISFCLMALGYLAISSAGSLTGIILGTVIAGLGVGMLMPNQTLWLMATVPADARGRAAGLLTTAIFAGQFASPLISGLIAPQVGINTTFTIFATALILMSVAMAIAAIRSNRISEAHK
jgi:MFS family permease